MNEKSLQPIPTVLYVLAGFKLLFHVVINAPFAGDSTTWTGYEIFRDELYYLACADHLAWGYVDQPPLSIFLLAATRAVIGDSLFALRLVPALAGAVVVFLTGLLARELGGGRLAMTLSALASLVAGATLAFSSIWSMNIIDLLLVAVAMLILARILRTGEARLWIPLGIVLGLGLLNKVGVLWIGLGIAVGLVATRERRWLVTPWPWLGGLSAMLIFAPYVFWNASHDWAHLEFIDSAVSGKYSGLDAWTFLSGQVLSQNPTTLLLWLVGLGWLLFSRSGQSYRLLGIVWVAACVVLLANGHSKSIYLASAYVILFAAGGVAWEQMLPRRAAALAVSLVACGLLAAPLATPVLPVEAYIRYAETLGFGPSTDEGHELAELPQFYADMFGWEAKATAVAAASGSLTPVEREQAVVYADNYGRAGAIDYFAEEYDLPRAISGHNNYWHWGPAGSQGEVVILLGGEREDHERRFESVEQVGVATCSYCIPYERDLPIFVGRDLRLPVDELWPLVRHYD